MSSNKHPELLKIGDKVTSDFYLEESKVIRTLTCIKKDSSCGSGYRASADAGEKCPCCGKFEGKPIGSRHHGIDAAWFNKLG